MYERLDIAIAHHQAGRRQQARQLYEEILSADPNHADALHLLGLIHYQVGDIESAIEKISRALALKPNSAVFLSSLGAACQAAGKFEEAAASCRRALEIKPHHVPAHNNMGLALKAQGKLDEAVASYRRALQIEPDYAEGHLNLGAALAAQGKLEEAITSYRRAAELKPDYVEAHNNLGVALKDCGRLEEAVACYRRALQIEPDNAGAHNNLGNALKDLGKPDEAMASYRQALDLKPDFAEAHNNLGNLLKDLGHDDEAMAAYWRALAVEPNFAEPHNNLANLLKNQGKLEEAARRYERALQCKPDYAEAHWNHSLLLLLRGDFKQGWPEYEWRWHWDKFPSRGTRPPGAAWDGSSLNGRTILLHAEQGLGDTIQFVRYAKQVKQLGGTVIARVQLPLCRLLAGIQELDSIAGQGQQLPHYDVHAAFMSLPAILGTMLETIPAEAPYLHAEQALVEKWKSKLADVRGLKVGLAWQGSKTNTRDLDRSISLSRFKAWLEIEGASFVSLQKGHGEQQIGEAGLEDRVTHFMDRVDDFADTAAIIEHLDLVITVDTSVAHLAGAMGKPTWVLLPFAPDWRWMLDREDSPWYPRMRLFRQQTRGDWVGIVDSVEVALRELL